MATKAVPSPAPLNSDTRYIMGGICANLVEGLSTVAPELKGLPNELTKMQHYFARAEQEKDVTHNRLLWLQDLSEIAYEAEDGMDELVLASESLFSLKTTSKTYKKLHKLEKKAQETNSKLESRSRHSPRQRRAEGWQPSKGDLTEEEEYVVGIEEDVEKLVKQLTEKYEPFNYDVLAIVGMGGSGKTTLAREIYKHSDIKEHFDRLAWVTLSQQKPEYVIHEITKQINCEQQSKKGISENSDDESKLGDVLLKKPILVVLDDVWELEALNEVLQELVQHAEESDILGKILITSRNHDLRYNGLKWHYYETHCLDEKHSWMLFEKFASKDSKGLDKKYKILGKEMARKCQGLPLAIVVLGKLVKTKDTIQEWENVFALLDGKESRYLYGPVNDIFAVSYNELPDYLKLCFLYLGLFPEGSSICTGMLIRMWIAEGFVCQGENDSTVEETARCCLQKLINYSMVQVETKNYAGQPKTIRMHEIMRDLCVIKGQQLCLHNIISRDSEATTISSGRAAIDISMQRSLPANSSHLRSLILFRGSDGSCGGDGYYRKRNQVTLNLEPVCLGLKKLRVLDISGVKTLDGTLPKEIGSLGHLRYLRIRSTNIRELPKSIGKLRNLLTLDYWDVAVNTEIMLPNVLWKLTQLRHLYLPNEMGEVKGKLKLHPMNNLQTLWGVGGGSWMLKELNSIKFPLTKLYIHAISSLEQKNALLKSDIVKHLKVLALDWYGFELDSLEPLCLSTTLEKLRLIGKTSGCLKKFPPNLKKLELYYTRLQNPESLNALGSLESLRFLRLSKDSYVGSKWTGVGNTFKALEELRLCNLQNLEEWEMEEESMSCLKKLTIVSCIKLGRLPTRLRSIHTLKTLEIERMPYSFCSKLQEVRESLETKGKKDYSIPEIKILDICVSLA